MATRQCLLGLISNHWVVFGEPCAINYQPLKVSAGYLHFALPKVPSQCLGRGHENRRCSREVFPLHEALDGVLHMLNPHRDVPPVKNVSHLSVGCPADKVWERSLPIRNHGDGPPIVPPEGVQIAPKLSGRRAGSLWRKPKTTTHVAGFDLAYHNIKVTFLILRPTSDMGAIDKYGQRL